MRSSQFFQAGCGQNLYSFIVYSILTCTGADDSVIKAIITMQKLVFKMYKDSLNREKLSHSPYYHFIVCI